MRSESDQTGKELLRGASDVTERRTNCCDSVWACGVHCGVGVRAGLSPVFEVDSFSIRCAGAGNINSHFLFERASF